MLISMVWRNDKTWLGIMRSGQVALGMNIWKRRAANGVRREMSQNASLIAGKRMANAVPLMTRRRCSAIAYQDLNVSFL